MTPTNGLTATTTAATPGGPRIDTATITMTLATALATLAIATGGPWAVLALAAVTAIGIHHTHTR